MKRLWAAAGTITAGLTINYLYGLWGNQSVPDLQRLSRVLWSYWGWTGGALTGFAIVSLVAARAHRRHHAPQFLGAQPGRREHPRTKPQPAPATSVSLIVGRENELTRLQEWFAEARAGNRQMVFVAGEAGIGKTSFVQAFLNSIENDRPDLISERSSQTRVPSSPWLLRTPR